MTDDDPPTVTVGITTRSGLVTHDRDMTPEEIEEYHTDKMAKFYARKFGVGAYAKCLYEMENENSFQSPLRWRNVLDKLELYLKQSPGEVK